MYLCTVFIRWTDVCSAVLFEFYSDAMGLYSVLIEIRVSRFLEIFFVFCFSQS